MSQHRVILSYEDYAALPSDRRRYELREGELSMTPAPVVSASSAISTTCSSSMSSAMLWVRSSLPRSITS